MYKDKENKKENENLQPAWRSTEEITLSLISGYDTQVENQIMERLQRLSLPILNQQQIGRSIRKIFDSAAENLERMKDQQDEAYSSNLTVRFCVQSNGAAASTNGTTSADDQSRCWGFFLVESNAHQPDAETDKPGHVLDVFIYKE